MKTILLNVIFLFVVFFNIPSFADPIIVNGAPITLTPSTDGNDDAYTAPSDYMVQPYNYVMLDNVQRICYPDTQPSLANLDVKVITVKVESRRISWYCYEYNTEYFKINP